MSNRETVKKLLELLRTHKKSLIIIIGCLLVSTFLHLCIPLLSKNIMDEGFIGGNRKLLIKLVLISTLIYGVDSIIAIYKEKKRLDIFSGIQYLLSEQAYSHLMKIKIDYFNTSNYTEIMNNVSIDISSISSIADDRFFFVISQVFTITGGMIGLLLIDYRMTLMVLFFIPLKYVVMKSFISKRKKVTKDLMIDSQVYAKWFGDTVAGIKEVRLFGIFNEKHKEFSSKYTQIIETQKRMNMMGLMNILSDRMMVELLIMILYIVGSGLVMDMKLSVGSVFTFVTYSTYVTGPISAMLNIGYLLAGVIPSTKRYYEFMELEEEKDGVESKDISFENLECEGLEFGYKEDECLISNVNFFLEKGQKYAFIGENGSGKSTILNLILRLYEPTKGKILLNGQDISMYAITNYRQLFSVVSQEVYLFDDTVRNNICLYKTIGDNDIIRVCKDSGLEGFSDFDFLDYRVGVNGCMLSGGQKQKVALARALIQGSPIIIFDEATSNADIQSEMKINELLYTRLKGKTVIIVTHRPDILNNVDHIYRIHNGTVVGESLINCIV